MSDTETKLKPCPFCGYEAKVAQDTSSDYPRQWDWGVYCQRQWPSHAQECSGSICGFKTETEAVDWWNKRAPVKRECPCGEEMDEKGCPNGH